MIGPEASRDSRVIPPMSSKDKSMMGQTAETEQTTSRSKRARKQTKDSERSPIEEWRMAPASWIDYPSARVGTPDGRYYMADGGRRLEILDNQVMDTCEAAWATEAVRTALNEGGLNRLNPSYRMKVLSRGAGLHISDRAVIEEFLRRGSGDLHIIELNEQVADEAERWRDAVLEQAAERKRNHGLRGDINITIHRGEAREVTERLVSEGMKFNLVIADTFPLKEEEEGINDLMDVDVIKSGLYREGVFVFFPYYPASESEDGDGHLTIRQLSFVNPHFTTKTYKDVPVKPPAGYEYLFHADGTPVRSLPLAVFTGKR